MQHTAMSKPEDSGPSTWISWLFVGGVTIACGILFYLALNLVTARRAGAAELRSTLANSQSWSQAEAFLNERGNTQGLSLLKQARQAAQDGNYGLSRAKINAIKGTQDAIPPHVDAINSSTRLTTALDSLIAY